MRHGWVGVAVVCAAMMLGGCAHHDPGPSPLLLGGDGTQTHTEVCVSDLGDAGTFYGGERLENTTGQAARITSVEILGVENLLVETPLARPMEHDDPHFLAVSAEDSVDPSFARALVDLESLDGMELPGGSTVGIVLEMRMDGSDVGQVGSLAVTYEIDDETYREVSNMTFSGAATRCPA